MKYSIIVTETLHFAWTHTQYQLYLYVWQKQQISIRELAVTVSCVYVLTVSGDSWQNLSLVKSQKGSSELCCKLTLTQCFSVALEILKQNFKFSPFWLEAFGFANELVNFPGTGLFNVEILVLELSWCSKVHASWTWCTFWLWESA